jgi:pyridoxal phosphate enzyme (YggS family)
MDLGERLERTRAEIARHCEACGRDPASVELLPISKKHPADRIRELFHLGVRACGENRVQELVQKAEALPDLPIRWHMVGSLQTNKVKQLLRVGGLELLQSLDRQSLADVLQRGLGSDRKLRVLLQVHATDEASKHGCPPGDVPALVDHLRHECPSLEVRGVMAMGPLEGDPVPVFRRVAGLHKELQQSTGLDLPVLSMGMTDDMAAAIAAGSTMVRVGTGVFGPRA